jgi:3-hydroxyethyl bacteriochlorophyllide a dehydrogenase
MKPAAVVMQAPQDLVLDHLELDIAGDNDLVVDIEWSGISTGTEKLLWTGRMPTFPGMGYPLVPGYESVGQVVAAGPGARHR